MSTPLISSLPASCDHIVDFDLVTVGGRVLLVGSPDRDRLVCTWDPASDRWTRYELDVPAEEFPHTELTSLGAAVVDGRIVIGGGGDHQGFVLWDPSDAGPEDDSVVDIEELECRSGTSSAAAAGLWTGRPVVVAGGSDGGVLVWDIEEERPLAEFDDLDEELTEFALASVDGRTRVVAAGENSVVLGDLESSEWGERMTVPGGEISCLTAATVHGRPFAVTGASDGTIRVWDLAGCRLLGQPQGHNSEVFGVRIADLDSRPVLISSAHRDPVHLWEFPS
ncbi:WD40 repeat domain-containing protein [Stackebrandtia nassauensis]|uniref:WD-40 repeat protein n=1 Tax=Stackebrandtia nassauensis (strain DSM 44728 / CIP 108903 / NRRL B-16338 / NBRC 102104 / LLR-40K-21) TaxID=446470 RepID=D3PY49_STANL|nr:hypothetical protein [Stackebrandtia nassauensis]ADD45378.1 WD-40 repeat protein [Stackebrandtia nassauensis DSM 44728]